MAENGLMILRDFAFTGNNDFYFNKLSELEEMAEKENWTIDSEYPLGVLKFYIDKTFERAFNTNNILFDEKNDYCCFNTGLLTKNYESIIMMFKRNEMVGRQEWFFIDFFIESNREFLDKFEKTPCVVKHYDNFEDLIFDPNLEIVINYQHIIEENWERFHTDIANLGKPAVQVMLKGVVESTKKLIERNHRIAVPQYYNNKIMFLLPLNLPVNNKIYTMALAVEKVKSRYRANTIFTLDWAYSLARLISKPENSWLIPNSEI